MEVVLNSILLVAAAEMGDKTQLLALVLAVRFRKPWAVLAGIFAATVLNHLLAALAGQWLAGLVPENYLRWILAAVFIAFALWILVPDKDEDRPHEPRFGAFLTTTILFFLAEIGDKTQLSTVALAARYGDIILVTIGTTIGMLLADGLAVFFGEKLSTKIPMKWIRVAAAALFALFGLALLIGFRY